MRIYFQSSGFSLTVNAYQTGSLFLYRRVLDVVPSHVFASKLTFNPVSASATIQARFPYAILKRSTINIDHRESTIALHGDPGDLGQFLPGMTA